MLLRNDRIKEVTAPQKMELRIKRITLINIIWESKYSRGKERTVWESFHKWSFGPGEWMAVQVYNSKKIQRQKKMIEKRKIMINLFFIFFSWLKCITIKLLYHLFFIFKMPWKTLIGKLKGKYYFSGISISEDDPYDYIFHQPFQN